MSLGSLPVEILEQIVDETLPEGFESFALTCRDIHAICKPFIQQHKELRALWDDFRYGKSIDFTGGAMHDAYRILEAIAAEPKIMRYIRIADFTEDPFSRRAQAPLENFWEEGASSPYRADIFSLLTASPHFATAELEPREYYEQMFRDLKRGRVTGGMYYSQHAFTFLLTLLPNLQTIKFPDMWRPTEDTTALLRVIAENANSSFGSQVNASLAQLTTIWIGLAYGGPTLLEHVHPFTALPRLSTLKVSYVVTSSPCHELTPQLKSRLHSTSALTDLRLWACCIEPASMSDLLQHLPCLKTLKYYHTSNLERHEGWDMYHFLTVIVSCAARSLERLSLIIDPRRQPVWRGQVKFADFIHLKRLTIPPEILGHNLRFSGLRDQPSDEYESAATSGNVEAGQAIGTLLPHSLCRLKLYSHRMNEHMQTLQVVLEGFGSQKKAILPNMSMLKVQGNVANHVDKEQFRTDCATMLADCKDAGITLVALQKEMW